MKNIIGLIFVAVFALVGCDRTDEQQEIAANVQHAYEKLGNSKTIPTGNIAAGKIVAKKCAHCHGIDGVKAEQGAPFISGMPQEYIVSAMLAYADGSRENEQMKLIAIELKQQPEQIANVSDYYASLKTPWKGANVGNRSANRVSLDHDTIQAGAIIASGCNQCHGLNRNATGSQLTPVLAGMTPEYFIPALKSYFNGKRDHGVMKIFGSSIKEGEIEQLAAYFAVQPPFQLYLPGKGDAKAGGRDASVCAGCHSIDGNALNPNIPSLAGQPAEYLIKAIKDYRDGRREDAMMTSAVSSMQDQTIENLAAHYSSQKPEFSLSKSKQSFSPVAEGAKIAGSCDGCHGKNGNSEKMGIPSLTGLDVKYLVSATKYYRDGIRKNKLMKTMVGTLSDTDIEKVAFFYATQLPSSGKAVPKSDFAAGEKISAGCTSCHGEGGISKTPGTPSLAGQDASYLAAATLEYARGIRNIEIMTGPVKELKPSDVINVTSYFASLKAAKPDTVLPLSPQFSITQKCDRCHGENGKGGEPGIPRLAGQSEAYLVLAIKEYHDGKRKQHVMNAMSDTLSLVEIKAIAAYYARQ